MQGRVETSHILYADDTLLSVGLKKKSNGIFKDDTFEL